MDAGRQGLAADALKAELAARPEWASDIGPAAAAPGADRSALVAELNKRNLRGFDVTVRIETFKKEMKDPRPGGRLKQLAVNDAGSSSSARRSRTRSWPSKATARRRRGRGVGKEMAADSANVASKAALKSAVKQAVDQAVVKLGAVPTAAQPKKPAKKKS